MAAEIPEFEQVHIKTELFEEENDNESDQSVDKFFSDHWEGENSDGNSEYSKAGCSKAGTKMSQSARKIRQRLRNLGQSYESNTGKPVEARKCKPLQDCKRKCSTKISRDNQLQIFDTYWSQGAYLKRVGFVKSLIRLKQKAQCRSKVPSRLRKYSVEYHLPTTDARSVQVCRKCFKMTLGETEAFIQNVLNKTWEGSGDTPDEDLRGKKTPKNKTSEDVLNEIRRHINKFPVYERKCGSSSKFLQEGLTITRMHELYRNEVQKPSSMKVYRTIFNETGFTIKKIRLDKCSRCGSYDTKIKTETDELAKNNWLYLLELHRQHVETALIAKTQDKKRARESEGSRLVCSLDLQTSLATPCLPKSALIHYKRYLCTYMFNISRFAAAKTTCYMWHEAEAERGPDEIASCVYKFLWELRPNVEHVIFYSDPFSGLIRNERFALMVMILLAHHPCLKIVECKFYETGHMPSECDSDRGVIEKTKRMPPRDIHCPDDWYETMRHCKKENNMDVAVMTKELFYNFERHVEELPVVDANYLKQFTWNQVKWLRFIRGSNVLQYKEELHEDTPFSELSLSARMETVGLKQKYDQSLKIAKEKKEDLMSILGLLRSSVRHFYQNLPATEEPAGVNWDPDLDSFEIEETIEDDDETQKNENADTFVARKKFKEK